MNALKVSGLRCCYNGKAILDGLDLDIARNEILCLLGSSGCGKTTLLKAVAGLLPLSAGSIAIEEDWIDNGSISLAPEKRNIGMIFQDYALFPHLTVFDNIAFGLHRRPKAETHRRVIEILELVKLDGLERRYPHQLSGGQQQRVAIARALVCKPKLMLLDEPFSNIDSQVRQALIGEIRALLKQQQIAAIFVTHSKEEAFAFADRLAVFHQGRIEQIGAPTELYWSPSSPFVAEFLGRGNYLDARVVNEYQVDTELGRISSTSQLVLLPGSECQLFLRPPQLKLQAIDKVEVGRQRIDSGTRVDIVEQQFLGAQTRYLLRYRGRLLEASSSDCGQLSGQARLHVAPHPLVLFSPRIGQRRQATSADPSPLLSDVARITP